MIAGKMKLGSHSKKRPNGRCGRFASLAPAGFARHRPLFIVWLLILRSKSGSVPGCPTLDAKLPFLAQRSKPGNKR